MFVAGSLLRAAGASLTPAVAPGTTPTVPRRLLDTPALLAVTPAWSGLTVPTFLPDEPSPPDAGCESTTAFGKHIVPNEIVSDEPTKDDSPALSSRSLRRYMQQTAGQSPSSRSFSWRSLMGRARNSMLRFQAT